MPKLTPETLRTIVVFVAIFIMLVGAVTKFLDADDKPGTDKALSDARQGFGYIGAALLLAALWYFR